MRDGVRHTYLYFKRRPTLVGQILTDLKERDVPDFVTRLVDESLQALE